MRAYPVGRSLVYASVAVLATAAVSYVAKHRRARVAVVGSLTNANEIVDSPEIPPDASPDEVLDVAVEYTFPASDPIAIVDCYTAALRRELTAANPAAD
jgi:molybdopterin biosynthesis enzyme